MNRLKLVFGIAVPMLVIVVTMVMVGVSFAWFSNADKVTISEITFSTAESYSVGFGMKQNEDLWDNIEYAGQEAFNSSGQLLTTAVAGENSVAISNMPYYFVNTVVLNTKGNDFDISMIFDSVDIFQPKRNANSELIDKNGNVTSDYSQIEVDYYKKQYGAAESHGDVADIPYAFTWMFKEHVAETKTLNYQTQDEKNSMLPLTPSSGDIWYTPYGTFEFDKDAKLSSVNGVSVTETTTIADLDNVIKKFNTSETGKEYDFYIIFAPQKMFYMQFFSADNNKKVNEVYTTEAERKKIFENLNNMMFYSSMDYSGSMFKFSAVISVEGVTEKTDQGVKANA